MLGVYAAVLLKRVDIGEIIQEIDIRVGQSYSNVFADEAGDVAILYAAWCSGYICGLFVNFIDEFADLLMDPDLVLLHDIQQEGNLDCGLG